ncbi:MAG: hypothetical protein ACI9LV_000917 [Candidatus Nanohaloarchaea archaeon]|jgi:hypothetical protein
MTIPKDRISRKIEENKEINLELGDSQLIQDLSDTVEVLLDKTQWFKNIRIQNKNNELERFREYRENGKNYRPNFEFEEYPHKTKQLKQLIEKCRSETEKIDEKHLKEFGAETIGPEDMKEFFTEIFREIELYIKLADEIESEQKWREISEKTWPMIEKRIAEESTEYLKNSENTEPKGEVSPERVAEMFRKEIDRLGMDYKVETRRTAGCFNAPEEKTVVVARGEEGERVYSEDEAKMVTMHEIFHAVRAYNGFKAGEKSGFPEIIGLHTPFYDRAEEGGALYREKATETMYTRKEFDYHLRLVASYEISESDNFREEFSSIAEKLIDLGATEERAFHLLARNREALRHHIYLGGYHDWKDIENKEKMLVGKVNEEWADRFWEEAEAGGMIQKPAIGSEKLFDFTFKDSE